MLSQEKLNELLKKAISEVKDAEIEVLSEKIIPNIRIAKARSFYGICKKKPEGLEISISKYHLSNSLESVYQTIVHEVLHTVDGCMNHGTKWKVMANRMNKKYGYSISRLGTAKSGVKLDAPPKKVVYKYIIVCQNCGHTYKRQRKSKLTDNLNRYRCGKCGGELKRRK